MRRAAAATLLLIAACAGRVDPVRPGQGLRPPSDFAVDFLLRQEVVFRRGETEQGLQTALQRRGDELVLVGLTPLGTRAFVVEQRGLEVTASGAAPEEELPFPPRLILLDIQRTLLPLLGPGPLADGEHRGRAGGVRVRERWRGGRLLERRLRTAEGSLRITYGDGGYEPGSPPGPIELDHEELGVRLTLTTLAYQELPRRAASSR